MDSEFFRVGEFAGYDYEGLVIMKEISGKTMKVDKSKVFVGVQKFTSKINRDEAIDYDSLLNLTLLASQQSIKRKAKDYELKE